MKYLKHFEYVVKTVVAEGPVWIVAPTLGLTATYVFFLILYILAKLHVIGS